MTFFKKVLKHFSPQTDEKNKPSAKTPRLNSLLKNARMLRTLVMNDEISETEALHAIHAEILNHLARGVAL